MTTPTELKQIRLNIGFPCNDEGVDDGTIEFVGSQYPDSDYNSAQRVFFSTIDILEFLKSQYAHTAYRARQRLGPDEEEAYGNQLYEAICDLLTYWQKKTPPSPDNGPATSLFVFGGVSKEEFQRVNDDPDSRNNWDQEVTPYNVNDLPYNRYLRSNRFFQGYIEEDDY